jgi:hypothetical protein
MFKRDGVYWVMLGPCSCFGPGGSPTLVYVFTSPLSPAVAHAQWRVKCSDGGIISDALGQTRHG